MFVSWTIIQYLVVSDLFLSAFSTHRYRGSMGACRTTSNAIYAVGSYSTPTQANSVSRGIYTRLYLYAASWGTCQIIGQ
jgi:hypothetical protein